MDPTANDIVYNQFSLNLFGIFDRLGGDGPSGFFSDLLAFLAGFWDIYSIVAILLSIVFITLTIYAYLKINEYSQYVSDQIAAAERAWRELHGAPDKNSRWQEVLAHAASDRPNDWKLAIIEADIMLGEGLTNLGYAGMSIGEQLRSVSPAHLTSVQDAWDAHRIRNRIAHEGTDFVLTQGMVREAIVKYERALKELEVI